jgi:hypothetical protein
VRVERMRRRVEDSIVVVVGFEVVRRGGKT